MLTETQWEICGALSVLNRLGDTEFSSVVILVRKSKKIKVLLSKDSCVLYYVACNTYQSLCLALSEDTRGRAKKKSQ